MKKLIGTWSLEMYDSLVYAKERVERDNMISMRDVEITKGETSTEIRIIDSQHECWMIQLGIYAGRHFEQTEGDNYKKS